MVCHSLVDGRIEHQALDLVLPQDHTSDRLVVDLCGVDVQVTASALSELGLGHFLAVFAFCCHLFHLVHLASLFANISVSLRS